MFHLRNAGRLGDVVVRVLGRCNYLADRRRRQALEFVAVECACCVRNCRIVGWLWQRVCLVGVSRLYPGKQPLLLSDRITDDRFLLLFDQADAQHDLQHTKVVLQSFQLLDLEERIATAGGIQ